jgi:Putative phage tail protein
MFGGKNNALHRAYLAGLQAQTSVYGATIPQYYGRTRGNPLLIWGANLRNGGGLQSNKKGKGKKKGLPNFVENVDFLLGHNPIAGVLQFWYNSEKLGLNFQKLSTVINYPFANSNGNVVIADPNFYFVIGVTANVTYSVTFNDYGGQGSRVLTGTFEMPLWNVNYAGPDPTNQNGARQYPAIYSWIPYSGATINFPAGSVGGIPNIVLSGASPEVNIYYAQLDGRLTLWGKSGDLGTNVPITALRLAFEGVLGSGPEYSDAGLSAQQILYPPYAGLESSDFDMGSTGVAAATLPEVMGSFPVQPSGDADYADMIEDIFKSGPAQAGTGAAVAYGDIHHGLGCLDFPGTIQKKILDGGVEPWLASFSYDLPNTAGNLLFVLLTQDQPGNVPTISDSAGNTWTALMTGAPQGVQLWYAHALASSPGTTITIGNRDRFMEVILLEVAGLDTIDGTPTYTSGNGGTYTPSAVTTNKPGEDSLVLSFVAFPATANTIRAPEFHWKNIATSPVQNSWVDSYRTKYPGTYSTSYAMASSNWYGVVVALKNSQPNSFTSPLGNILDDTTMQQVRLQDRAYGLSGSLVMDSQKKAADWLAELYQVANAAPVWSGDKLKNISLAEQSMAGNGAIFTSPTATGPIANLTESDFIAEGIDAPVTVSRSAQVDAPNLQQIQYPNRDSNYDMSVAAQPDNGSMSLYGTRKDSPKVFKSIQTSVTARAILGIMVREANIVRNIFSFKAKGKWALLEAMDLLTIPIQSTMPAVNPGQPAAGTIALRLTSVSVDDKFGVTCEAEPFIYGLRTPLALAVTTPNPNSPQFGEDPGIVNPPIIFEAVPSLAGKTNVGQLWLLVSGGSSVIAASPGSSAGTGFTVGDTLSVGGGTGAVLTVASVAAGVITGLSVTSEGTGYQTTIGAALTVLTGSGSGSPTANITVAGTAYGGTVAYVSTDGGNSYNVLGVIQGSATTGKNVTDWPANADPDTTNDLLLDLTESLGSLASYQVADEDNFVYPCYEAGGGANPIPYELMSYALANLTATYKYTLKATGGGTNHLRRAVFGAPAVAAGVDHPIGSRFAFLDPNNPNAAGILRVPLDPSWIGVTLYFKFPAFNSIGGGMQTLASAIPYTYTPTGAAGGVNPGGVTPGAFLVNGG